MNVANYKDKVTLVVTTFGNLDFTKAALWAFRRFYPEVEVILADGGSTYSDQNELRKLGKLVTGYGATSEECCNMASTLVQTPLVLFMDNDCKVTGPRALPLLVEALASDISHACTGAYGVKVVDWRAHVAFTGTVFSGQMELDATARYIQLHRTDAFRKAGMFPTDEWFYPDMAEHFDPREYPQGCQGDMTIGRRYQRMGWKVVSPRETVPCIHWGAAKVTAQADDTQREPERWYAEHVKHTRLDPRPLNDWEKV